MGFLPHCRGFERAYAGRGVESGQKTGTMFPRSLSPFALMLAAAVAVSSLPLNAQVPTPYPPDTTQYPPGQYPPNQYPPGQYPPNQYPPNQYPARLPGGVPIGIQIPEIKLPKRKPKDEGGPKSTRELPPPMALKGIEGTLRKLGEKDLLAETKQKGILQFRVLAKTKFVDEAGEAVRDSLLKPGDHLRIEVNADDEETALRVTLLKKGTPEERAAAEKPVAPGQIKTPEGLAPSTAVPPTRSESGLPTLPRGLPSGSTSGSGDPTVLDSDVEEAREAANAFSATLPNYVVEQVTTRYTSNTQPPQWHAMDVVAAEVAYVDGKEEYRNITINGRPAQRPVEKTGSWSTGEFGTTLEDILSPATNASFKRLGEQNIGNRMVVVYEFSVKQPNSHWTIVSAGQRCSPAFTGTLYIERVSHRVLRIEQVAEAMPSSFPFEKAESIVDYDYVRIDQASHLLPSRSENSICKRGMSFCSRNEIEFRNYRKFTTESQIKF